jgi:hypothetical protein
MAEREILRSIAEVERRRRGLRLFNGLSGQVFGPESPDPVPD